MTTFRADILIEDGKIKEIGTGLTVSEGCSTFDAAGLQIYPGFADAHCHVDLVITDGCPFRVETEVKAVYINGVKVEA
ncbi:MAG: hypothetical protein J1E83_10475 [Lachnospiraceae bacterium]|nr:hypothetical protein [Lachnospiraceae bacterium]